MSAAKVLVLEPAGQVRSKVSKALQSLKLEASVSGSLAEAVAHAQAFPVSAVIADISALAGAGGKQADVESAINQLRAAQKELAEGGGHLLAVIVTSPSDDVEAHAEALRAGADHYLTAAAAATKDIVGTILARYIPGGHSAVRAVAGAMSGRKQIWKPQAPAPVVTPRSGGHATEVFALRDEHLRSTESGRWNARLIADAMGIDLKQLAAAINVGYSTIFKTPDSVALQEKLAPFANVMAIAFQTYAGDSQKIQKWLRAPQPNLGGKTALEGLLMPGKAAAVESFVTNAWMGIPA